MPEAFIVDGIRTPIGSFCGSLSGVRADDLAAHVIKELLSRHPALAPGMIEDVILGCANQAGEDNRNVARMALLLAGLPASVPGETVNRLCASGMCASINAAHSIMAGEGDLFIAGGVESMTRAPYVLSKGATPFARNAELFDTSIGWRFINPKLREQYGTDSMGETAENLAAKYQIARLDQDRFAAWSQHKAAAAKASGRLGKEICAITIAAGKEQRRFEHDEFIRPDSNAEILAKLKPAFRTDGKGTVTAGNSSGLNDGACALLISSEKSLNSLAAKPLARIRSSATAGVEPRIMGIGPVEASHKALRRAGLKLSEVEVIEINEAFAVQVLACCRELGLADNDPRINPNGGAIALGHPLGMSGARLLLSAARELEASQKKLALCTMCVGVGQGVAVVLERV
ncbi:MAG: acetyl-CoA C-acyltransferase [Oligoflexia bacterium]|nr:acetyl-CoA C-acyltransferase [Oligoflexia bacterium]